VAGSGEINGLYGFGPFRLDTRAKLLCRGDRIVNLKPKVVETLIVLVESHGRLVPKEELLRAVWPDAFVEEGSLAQNISILRKALGDGEELSYIETIPKRGYCFVAPVEQITDTAKAVPSVEPSAAAAPPSRRQTQKLIAIAGSALAIVLTVIVLWKVTNKVPDPSANVRSVAVLPFVDDSPSGNQDYFADGMTEALITSLAKSPGLRVVSHTSVLQFKHPQRSLPEIARQLKVDGIVEGSVSREGDRVRITAKLVDGRTDLNLWSNSYRRDIGDVLGLQEEVAETITRAIGGRASRTGGPAVSVRLKPAALDSYLKARKLASYRTQEQLEQSIAEYRRAIAIEPTYAPAYAGLGEAYALLATYDLAPGAEVYPKLLEAAKSSLALEPTLSEAHTLLGIEALYHQWNWPAADAEFRHAVELNPSYAAGEQRYGLALMWMGRFDEALERIRIAQQLDPLSPMVHGNEGELLMLSRRYDEAIQFFRDARESKLDFFGSRVDVAAAYLGKRMYDPAIAELRTALRMGGGPIVNARLAHVYAVSGRRREAIAILDDLLDRRKAPHVSDYGLALAYAGLGETDRAMARLTNEFHGRSRTMVYLGLDPYLDPIRKDPRFRDLVRRVGLFE